MHRIAEAAGPAYKCKPLVAYSHADLRLAEALNRQCSREARRSLTDLRDSIAQGSLGDSHQSGEGVVQLQN